MLHNCLDSKDLIYMKWPEKTLKAVLDLEAEHGIELVSMDHHEVVQSMLASAMEKIDSLEREIQRLRSLKT